jgi:opacity protein-like surface antigen
VRPGAVAAVVLALALAAAAWAQSREDTAQAKAESWLTLVDEGKYDSSWDQAAAFFKRSITKERWRQAASAAREPLGKVRSRTLKARQHMTTLPGGPDGSYVVIQYDTSFERKAAAVETITPMLDPDGTWRVAGYYVR